jgi:FkbM family methyltransferase
VTERLKRWLRGVHRLPAGMRPTYVGDGRILMATRYGHFLYLDGDDLSLTPTVALLRRWEPRVTALFRRIVRPGAHVVEVGANVGWFTVQAADLVGPQGWVTAFEPGPRSFELLHRSVSANGLLPRCDLRAAAACDRVGTVVLHQMGAYGGSPRLTDFGDAELEWFHQPRRTFEVDATTLDLALEEPRRRIDILKMDAEGAESAVLDGAQDVLSASPALQAIVEFHPGLHGRAFLERWRELGFAVETIGFAGRTRPASFDELLAGTTADLYLRR